MFSGSGCSSGHTHGNVHKPGEPCCAGTPHSVRETVEEMDFQRGIWAAALDGDLNKVRSLIRKGTDPNQTDNFGYTALHYSSRHGHVPVCRFLLENGADSNSQTHGGSTALHRAAYCGHLEVGKLLLEFGADPARTDSDRRTALHKAAEGGQRNMYHFLLHHYNTLEDMRDGRGLTAADLAPSGVIDLSPT